MKNIRRLQVRVAEISLFPARLRALTKSLPFRGHTLLPGTTRVAADPPAFLQAWNECDFHWCFVPHLAILPRKIIPALTDLPVFLRAWNEVAFRLTESRAGVAILLTGFP